MFLNLIKIIFAHLAYVDLFDRVIPSFVKDIQSLLYSRYYQ